MLNEKLVAPARERGLKCCLLLDKRLLQLGRSREGAWIEIGLKAQLLSSNSPSLP